MLNVKHKELHKSFVYLLIACVLTSYLALLITWYEFNDPSFIANKKLHIIEVIVLPILSMAVIYTLFKKYGCDDNFNYLMTNHFFKGSKLVKGFLIVMYPCLIYTALWNLSVVPILYYAENNLGEPCSKEYLLTDVSACTINDEQQCIRLNLIDLSSGEERSFRWYLDTHKLQKIRNKRINLVGEKSYFGYIVNEIQW
ncbi:MULTISPECIES: hypothetical protein [Pseudoalteromonas]|uniref:Uncharacterized protein n=1 Tax=Pseudoalteromonas undina TaxID=43660 RepID=A0ACC6R7R3_9GAMM|nr:hypothetical protein [Pseudoalteromonas sp. P1-7a]KPZ61858.1 hypothetical protein AN389_01218 [Pseudoalteromonas sp. P1-7a]